MGPVIAPSYGCFYSRSIILNVGDIIYLDSSLTSPAPDSFYSDGTYCYTVLGGCGKIRFKSLCS